MNSNKHLVKTLNKKILDAQANYYSGHPTISDAEYDSLEAQLTSLVESDMSLSKYASVLNLVGDTKSNSEIRIKHEQPMLSIENYYTKQTFADAVKNYSEWLLIEPKLDGNSAELKYINGILVQAVTRGDGNAGEDMTAQIKSCKKIPQKINTTIHDLRIRGEIVMRESELARINKSSERQYSNTRNLVAGTLKQKDLSIVRSRELILIPWDMYSPNEDNLLSDSSYDRMKLAYSFGFHQYEGVKIKCEQIFSELDNILAKNEQSDIAADGVVIKADSHKVRATLGVGSKFTKWQHCFKPQNLSAKTILLGIEFGLGRTGKVTPVALLQPVTLGGAVISRASVNNETYMDKLGLYIDCEVEILRTGKVIPFIVKVTSKSNTKKIDFPTNCPSCNSTLVFDPTSKIIQRFCQNSSCPGKAAEQFAYVGHRTTLEIDNLGESMAAELVEKGINTLDKLFVLSNNVLYEKDPLNAARLKQQGWRSGVNVLKMCKSLEKAKTAYWDRWLAALNIPFIGHSLGEDIALALNLQAEDMENLPNLLFKIPALNLEKLGPIKTQSVVDWANDKDNVLFCKKLYDVGVRPSALVNKVNSENMKLEGIKFVITGTLSIGSRKDVALKLVELGAEELGSVTKNCNLLIAGEDCGSKLAKAAKLGIKVVNEDWVREVLGM